MQWINHNTPNFQRKLFQRKLLKKNLVLHKNLKVFPISIEHKHSPKKDQTFFQHCSCSQELGKQKSRQL